MTMAFFNINRTETGKRIKAYRKGMHLTIEGLAEKLYFATDEEISPTSIGKWERGKCDISEEHARALCKVFGCKLCELVVATLSFYDDERDQLVPLIIAYVLCDKVLREKCNFSKLFLSHICKEYVFFIYI